MDRVKVKSTRHPGDKIELSDIGGTLVFVGLERVGDKSETYIYLKPDDVEKLVVASLTWLNEQDPDINFTLAKTTKAFVTRKVVVPATEVQVLV